MPTDADFLAAIAANPADRLPRLVYADWLDEQGDVRGHYMRLDDALADLSPADDRYWDLRGRRERLADECPEPWLTEIRASTTHTFLRRWPSDAVGRWRVVRAAHERWTGESVPGELEAGWLAYLRATHSDGKKNPFADAAGDVVQADVNLLWVIPIRGEEDAYWCIEQAGVEELDPQVWRCRATEPVVPPIGFERGEAGPRLSELVFLELLDRTYPTGGMISSDVLETTELVAEVGQHFGEPSEFAGNSVYERDGAVVVIRPAGGSDGRDHLTAYVRAGVLPPACLLSVWGSFGGESSGVFIPEPLRPPARSGQLPPRVPRWRVAASAFDRGSGNGFDMEGKRGDDSTAVPWFERAAAAGDAMAARNLSVIYNRNNGVPPDDSKHRYWMHRAALLGDGLAMYHLGDWARVGHGRAKDVDEAEGWFHKSAAAGCAEGEYGLYVVLERRGQTAEALPLLRRAADRGVPLAQSLMGLRLQTGQDGRADLDGAVEWYVRAAEQGEKWALSKLGLLHAIGPEHLRDPAESERRYRQSAEAGSAEACLHLGLAFGGQNGYRTDHAEQAMWLERAGLAGNSEGYFNLGLLHHKGIGRPADPAAAFGWFRKAAEAGHAEAALNLGTAYRYGRTVPRDLTEALRWFRLAAEAGLPAAMQAVGVHYQFGEGVAQDHAEAMRWYRLAADGGCGRAHLHIARMYHGGFGVERDLTAAADWCQSAIRAGEPGGYALMGELYRDGVTGRPDHERAIRTWLEGVKLDPPVADCTYHLALAMLHGRGLPHDDEKGTEWLSQAIEQGSVEAEVEWGIIALSGEPTADDYEVAVGCFERASEDGSARGSFELAKLYEAGRGVPRDAARATNLYQTAAHRGCADAVKKLHALQGQLPVARRAIPVARRVEPRPNE